MVLIQNIHPVSSNFIREKKKRVIFTEIHSKSNLVGKRKQNIKKHPSSVQTLEGRLQDVELGGRLGYSC